MFSIKEVENNIQLVQVDDLLAAADNSNLVQAVQQSIDAGARDFVVDLKDTPYVSSLGLNCLISLLTRARNAGGEVVLIGVSPKLSQLLILTRLRNSFILCDNLTQALEHLQAKPV